MLSTIFQSGPGYVFNAINYFENCRKAYQFDFTHSVFFVRVVESIQSYLPEALTCARIYNHQDFCKQTLPDRFIQSAAYYEASYVIMFSMTCIVVYTAYQYIKHYNSSVLKLSDQAHHLKIPVNTADISNNIASILQEKKKFLELNYKACKKQSQQYKLSQYCTQAVPFVALFSTASILNIPIYMITGLAFGIYTSHFIINGLLAKYDEKKAYYHWVNYTDPELNALSIQQNKSAVMPVQILLPIEDNSDLPQLPVSHHKIPAKRLHTDRDDKLEPNIKSRSFKISCQEVEMNFQALHICKKAHIALKNFLYLYQSARIKQDNIEDFLSYIKHYLEKMTQDFQLYLSCIKSETSIISNIVSILNDFDSMCKKLTDLYKKPTFHFDFPTCIQTIKEKLVIENNETHIEIQSAIDPILFELLDKILLIFTSLFSIMKIEFIQRHTPIHLSRKIIFLLQKKEEEFDQDFVDLKIISTKLLHIINALMNQINIECDDIKVDIFKNMLEFSEIEDSMNQLSHQEQADLFTEPSELSESPEQ
ncbi:MAG: hypothetical protein HAW62_05240 [Endozoicomonadaceae bacterium]|nr:hypothetical protein [Endozoicomonadaceae bacterium]